MDGSESVCAGRRRRSVLVYRLRFATVRRKTRRFLRGLERFGVENQLVVLLCVELRYWRLSFLLGRRSFFLGRFSRSRSFRAQERLGRFYRRSILLENRRGLMRFPSNTNFWLSPPGRHFFANFRERHRIIRYPTLDSEF